MRYTEEKEKYLNTNLTKAFVKLLAFDQKKNDTKFRFWQKIK